MRNHTLSAVIAFAVIGASCSIDVRGDDTVIREEKRFTVSGQPDLRLRTFDGSIRLKSWDRNEILVEIERRGPDAETARRLTVDTSQQGNSVTVAVPEPPDRRDGFRFGQSPSVHLVVTTPRRMTLEARTGDGSIAADDLAGSITLNTGDGSIRVRRIEGGLRARTGDGSISMNDVNGQLDAETGDGSIDVDGRFDAVTVRSGDGSVSVGANAGSVLKADWSITTGDGSISVRLPANIDAELDAQSNDGRVSADGFAGLTTGDRNDNGAVRGRLGKGGRSLRVRSGDGSISINRR
jgi:hypothetical protein